MGDAALADRLETLRQAGEIWVARKMGPERWAVFDRAMAAGGRTYADWSGCNTYCATGTGSIYDVGDCINSADAFNNSGDNLSAPFDGVESGAPEYCQMADNTACQVLDPPSCSN